MVTLNNRSRGSEWRKWDLHVHTPGTKKNDQYRSGDQDIWTEFCDLVERSDVQAFGITDYFSADGYFEFIRKFRQSYPHSSKLFLPSIELCTSDVVNQASEEVNLHLIFNPFAAQCDESLRTFLSHLSTNKTVAGGRQVKASELHTRTEFEEATTSRAFIKSAFKETFGDKADLTDHVLIITAANNDGIRTATEEIDGKRRGVKRKALITDELDKFSNGFFGNSGNRRYFLDQNRLEDPKELAEAKPVVSGCDAHSFADLEHWLGKLVLKDGQILKEPTWIKAELTFEGLKQILYEPAARVFIGEVPEIEISARAKERRYIKSVALHSIAGYTGRCGKWFSGQTIELNKELVAIIGNKGSGKSALTDTLGLLGNSHNQRYANRGKFEELFSFLNSEKFLKGRFASNFCGELHWYAGEPDSKCLDAIVDLNSPENVEYLPQKYLEKICSNIEDDEFRQKLNAVIFEYVEPSEQYGYTNLDDLIKYKANQTALDIDSARNALHEENERVISIEKKLSTDHKAEIEEKIKRLQAEIQAHSDVRPKPVERPPDGNEQSTKGAVDIAAIETQLTSIAAEIGELINEEILVSKQIEDLSQAKQSIERHVDALAGLRSEYEELLSGAGLAFDDVVKVSVDFDRLNDFIDRRSERLQKIRVGLRKEDDILTSETDKIRIEEALAGSLVYQQASYERNRSELID